MTTNQWKFVIEAFGIYNVIYFETVKKSEMRMLIRNSDLLRVSVYVLNEIPK